MDTRELLDSALWRRTDRARKELVARDVCEIVGGGFKFLDLLCQLGRDDVEIARLWHEPTDTTWCLIPGGQFRMGLSIHEERAARRLRDPPPLTLEEMRPCHTESVQPLLLMQYPVSRSLVRGILSTSDLDGQPRFDAPEGRVPVYLGKEEVSKLTRATGFSLPTESQWEYACRAGTETLFFFGDSLPPESELEAIVSTRMLRPNGFGLHGLFVGEWCSDPFTTHYGGPVVGDGVFVIRGGGSVFWPWQDAGEWAFCVSAMRMPSTDTVGGICGVRLMKEIF